MNDLLKLTFIDRLNDIERYLTESFLITKNLFANIDDNYFNTNEQFIQQSVAFVSNINIYSKPHLKNVLKGIFCLINSNDQFERDVADVMKMAVLMELNQNNRRVKDD
jgi:hypothetical protein